MRIQVKVALLIFLILLADQIIKIIVKTHMHLGGKAILFLGNGSSFISLKIMGWLLALNLAAS